MIFLSVAVRWNAVIEACLLIVVDFITLGVDWIASAQFSLVQDGICSLGKAHMRSTPSLRSFPNVRLTDDGLLSSFQGRSSSASSFNVSLLRAIGDAMSLALCLQVVSQASQHFISSEKQANCEGCFARQSICSVISLRSSMPKAVYPQKLSKADVDH